jgi:hypothetical protein
MALINTNTGPERVEVISQPTGTIQVPGAATAITAFILRSSLAGAPVDTPVSVTSLEAAVEQFGDEDELSEAFYALRGFFSNAGSGNEAIIVNVSPTASGSEVHERGVAEAAGGGFIEDESEIATGLSVSSYAAATGVLTLGAPVPSSVQVGDYFKDDQGRLFLISAISGSDLTIPSGLNTLAGSEIHSAGGLDLGSTAGKVVRLFSADQHNSRALVQEGTSKGTVNITSSSALQANASAGGFLNSGAVVGDILHDSTYVSAVATPDAIFYITAVVDDDQVLLDRAGIANGAATILTGEVSILSDTKRSAGSNASVSPQNSVAFVSSGAGYGLLPTSVGPYPSESLNEHFAMLDSVEYEILSSTIVASGTLNAQFGTSANTAAYSAASGEVQFGGAEDLSTTNPGDVWRDAGGNDFVIDAVDDGADKITIAKNQVVNGAVGSTIRDGQVRVNFLDTSFDPGTTAVPTFFEPANQLDIPATETGLADAYFIASAVLQDSDYIGTAANGKGLHALDNTDDVNLVCMPGITSRAAQNALIDYCESERDDCFALLTIPENIRSAATDTVLASVVISTIVNGAEQSTIEFSGSPNLSAVSVGDLLDFNGSKFLIVDVDDADDKITVQSGSITGSGAASISSPSAVTYKEIVINNPSKRAAWYFNHVKVLRSSDSSILTVDPIGHVAGVMARTDANVSIGGVSRAPAGIGPAGLADTVDLDLSISENREGGPLRLNFINRLTSFPGAGRVVFGAYTADSGTSPAFTAEEQLIQVIRTNLFIKKSLERGLRAFIWDNFSPVVQSQAHNAILSFLRNNSYLFPAGRRENEQFQVISVEPTADDLARGLMRFRVLVSTNVGVRFLEIALEFPIPQLQS